MIREFLKSSVDKKNTVMFVTSFSFILGIASFFTDSELITSCIFTAVLITLVIKRFVPFKIILVWILVFYFGFFNAYFRIKNSDELVSAAPSNAEITGRITSIPNSNISNKTKFFFEVQSLNNNPLKAKTFVNIMDEDNDFSMFKVGQIYKISGKLRTPFKATNPSQFDYGSYLRNFDVFTILYADKINCVLINSDLPAEWKFLRGLNDFRNRIIDVHSKYLKSPNLEILGGIVFGDDAVAPPDYVKDSFINSGLLHILAASGMNVAFIFGFWFFFLSLLKVPYKARVISGIGVIVLYTLMTGLGASVIRAALMLIFVLLGKLIDRDSHGIALLSFVAFLMLLYNPAYLNDVGFQLSFIVTFGILCTAAILMEKVKGNKFRENILGALLVPVVAQIWVIPIQMFYFNTISLYSFFANVSIIPFLSVVSFGGFVSSVLAGIPLVGDWVCKVFDYVLNIFLTCIVSISNFFSSQPVSLIETSHPSLFQVVLYYLIVLLLTLMIKENCCEKRHLKILAGMILVLVLSTFNIPNGKLEVLMFDVGNADSFLIKTPKEKYILIDTGKLSYAKSKSQAEMIIRKYLKDKGVKSLELLVITHFDSDHAGGAEDFIKRMKVSKTVVNSLSDGSSLARKIYKAAEDKKVNLVKSPDDEVVYEEDGLRLKAFQKDLGNDNESSVMVLLSYGNFDILFTGDAGIDGFRRISDKMPDKVEVLKVGHHGAKGVVDTDYVNRLKPEVSLISTGKNNYGHPHSSTLAELSETVIFRTDKTGAVKIETSGNEYNMYKFNSSRKKFEYVMTMPKIK